MPARLPLYEQLQRQLNHYTGTTLSRQAVSDVLATVAQYIIDDHPRAGRHLIVEADLAHQAEAELLD